MTAKLQQYVQFIAWPDTQPKPYKVEDRNTENIKLPDQYSYGFYFFERYEDEIEAEGKKIVLVSRVQNESPVYFVRAKVLTYEQYEKRFPERTEILKRFRENKWEKIILLRTGEPIKYEGEDGAVFL